MPQLPESPAVWPDSSPDLTQIYAKLPPLEQEEARKLAETLSVSDSNAVTQFGSGIQQDIAEFAGSILSQVKSKNAGELGAMITELILKIKAAGPETDEKPGRSLAKIPVVGSLINRARRSVQQSHSVETQVDEIRAKLDAAYLGLHRDIEMLDLVMKKNYDYFKKLDLHIAAAQLRLNEAEQEELPALLQKTEDPNEPWAAQQANELEAFIRRLEKRLDDLYRTRFLSLSQAPRIRLLQQGEQLIMEKIQSVVYHLIPLWKMDLVTGLAQARASHALDLQSQVRGHIEGSMRQSAETMRRVSVGIARESESGMIGMDTLRTVQSELVATLEETMQVYTEGRKQRQEAERQMVEMERELRAKITETIRRTGT